MRHRAHLFWLELQHGITNTTQPPTQPAELRSIVRAIEDHPDKGPALFGLLARLRAADWSLLDHTVIGLANLLSGMDANTESAAVANILGPFCALLCDVCGPNSGSE
jgi:hypothetical protein